MSCRGCHALFRYVHCSGRAHERARALGVALGSGYIYETTFEKEVYSDLTGERGVLMGAINGIFQAQYNVLRANGIITSSGMPMPMCVTSSWLFMSCHVMLLASCAADMMIPCFRHVCDIKR